MTTQGKPTLGVGFSAGVFWWKGDHALVVVPFGGADQRDHDGACTYHFVPRNQSRGSHWQVADDLVVPTKR
ncbi:MAG: hypothetical protein ABIP94_19510 [Planctomycetota bacterium]